MAENTPRNERLPIKLILPRQGKEKKVSGGGSKPLPFRQVNSDFRAGLVSQVSAIRKVLTGQRVPAPAPLRVRLHSKAVAKTHRPEQLFSKATCPIVGAGTLGELFVKATPNGLDALTTLLKTGQSPELLKQISCVETIEAITPTFRLKGVEPADVLRKSQRTERGFALRVRLFEMGDDDQPRVIKEFEALCQERNVRASKEGYSPQSYVYGVECQTAADVEAISRSAGVRSVGSMPIVRALRPSMLNRQPLPKLLLRSDVTGDVPTVAVVDSGVSDQIPDLQPWIVGRESFVAPPYRNTDHGTFVAGLISWASDLNPTLRNVEPGPCAIFDVQVIPNGDPSRGDTDSLGEQEFLISLETALKQHANEFKVWNLSLGTDVVCSMAEFSEFAEQLDNLQERYEVSFVISAGNYNSPPLLDYPRTGAQIDSGRITTPADSVLGITVGSVSHVDYQTRGPKEHHPSAFSRHGAGPNYIIKPDLVHYGGACSLDATHQTGVRSLYGSGCAENIGTSFAAPLVSRTLAQIYHQITPTPKPVLARALLTHHARDPRSRQRVPDGEENFYGFGVPAPVPYCLECTPDVSTLVFEDVLRPSYYLEWDDFPYPPSLASGGRYFGEIWMTVALAPSRGARWGVEYCETHIDAHFGVYQESISKKTGEVNTKFVGCVPPEHKNPGELFESFQVQELRKWAPVRTYHGDLGERGVRGKRWRLKVKLLTRHGVEDHSAFRAQPFALILTIADPQKRGVVYDEMARSVLSRFQSQNLAVRAAARIRGRS